MDSQRCIRRSALHLLIAALLIMSVTFTYAQANDYTITLRGTITPEQLGKHELFEFTVPDGIQRMDIELISPGFQKGMYLTAGLFDPQRYRGEGRTSFTISPVDATGPYLPGPIIPGKWHLAIGYNYIAPKAHGNFTIRIHLSSQLDPEHHTVINSKPGWYKGDLHAHTGLTDGSCKSQSGANVPCPPSRLFAAAASQGLDFLAVTDHNTQAHFNQMMQDQLYYDKMLLIPGEEITTVKGHANVWGTEAFLDYRVAATGYTVNNLFDEAHRLHALVSINHAYWPTDVHCPGCGWDWTTITDFSKVDAIEIINGYHEHGSWFTPPPGNGIPFWEAQLAKGLRPTGVGGGDDHRAGEQLSLHNGIGIPTTVVYASELSQPAILKGIKAGHVYVKVTGPQAPDLYLKSGNAIMGDELKASTGQTLAFTLDTRNASAATPRLYIDGKPITTTPPLRLEKTTGSCTYQWTSDGKRHWIRAELIDKRGELITLTNPIYINWK
jgi:hypothetical protein